MRQSISNDVKLELPSIQTEISHDITTDNTQGTTINWWQSLKQVTPIYIAMHITLILLTYLATLFSLHNFSSNALPLSMLLDAWNRWDTGQFTSIATKGYDALYHMAFFPLFPLLERALAVVGGPFIAGLIISNMAMLALFMVLYRLVAEDFGAERAERSVLYLAVFPTAFFFAAAYNESLFLFLSLLSFYYMRKGYWWRAGLVALFASLTRSIAFCLVIPFAYEYLRQRNFQWRKIRLNVLSSVGIVGGIMLFSLYGYVVFHDPLAFTHAQEVWNRQLAFPWQSFLEAIGIIRHQPILMFESIHTVMDLSATLFILFILVLSFIGPWKFAREHWSYALYAAAIYLVVILVPEKGGLPLASMARFMLEIFPAFIVIAAMGQRRNFTMYYLAICLPLFAFMLLQWLTGGWIV